MAYEVQHVAPQLPLGTTHLFQMKKNGKPNNAPFNEHEDS